MSTGVLVIGIVMGFVWAYFGRRLAIRKGRDATIWPIICFFAGLIGIVVLALIPATAEKKAELAGVAVPDVVPLAWTEEMRKLSARHDAGELSDEDFTREKQRVLAQQ